MDTRKLNALLSCFPFSGRKTRFTDQEGDQELRFPFLATETGEGVVNLDSGTVTLFYDGFIGARQIISEEKMPIRDFIKWCR